MPDIAVRHEGGDRLRIRIRHHELFADQPVEDGGGDTGPTPAELFVAGLAACVGYYAERFLYRHAVPTEGLAVEADFAFAEDGPSRVASVDLKVILPPGFPQAMRERLAAVVEHCTVHNSIRHAPKVAISLDAAASAA